MRGLVLAGAVAGLLGASQAQAMSVTGDVTPSKRTSDDKGKGKDADEALEGIVVRLDVPPGG